MKELKTFESSLDALESLAYYCYDKNPPKEIRDCIALLESEIKELQKQPS